MFIRRRRLLLAFLIVFYFFTLLPSRNEETNERQQVVREITEYLVDEDDKQISFDNIAGGDVSKEEGLISDFPFKYLIDEPAFCSEDLDTVNIMPVSVGDFASRSRIRKMWGSREVVKSTNLRPLFLVGEARDAIHQQRLQEESDEYHDIIQLGFVDSYLNLTLKTLSALHWKQSRCPHVPWLLKSDADVFMNPWTVSETLKETKADFMCRVLYNRIVCRLHNCKDKRWVVPPDLYPHDHYPPYCNGPVYAVNQKYVQKILSVASAENPFPMEDAYFTGILVQGTGLKYRDIGNRCQLYHLKYAPHKSIASGYTLFVVNPEEKSDHRYTFADLWNNLTASRTHGGMQ